MSDSLSAPDVDYLTRDYEGYRQLLISLLDRSGTPWSERAAADIGVTLVEILANQLDHLSYAGDRVAGEAFLASARRRESIRRHAALGDYVLDRGSASSGYQHFELPEGKTLRLPAGACVAPPLEVGQELERRLVAHTVEDVELDARRNRFTLERSAACGSRVLHLSGSAAANDLRAIGLKPGMRLAVCGGNQRELVTVVRVQGGIVEIDEALRSTYLAGREHSVEVFGNLVPIRVGRPNDWQPSGRGGVELSEAGPHLFFPRRLEQLRALRNEVEAFRQIWGNAALLVDWWELANARVDSAVSHLRRTDPSVLGGDELQLLDQRLTAAAQLFREILEASGCSVPQEMRPTHRVSVPSQEIALEGEEPTLWSDGASSLLVQVGTGGHWTKWTEVEDFLESRADDRHYVVQVEHDGRVSLLFGDGTCGARLPSDGQVMVCRVSGDWLGSNLGHDTLTVMASSVGNGLDSTLRTTNPLPTSGGRPAEPVEDVATRIELANRTLALPVTQDEYKLLLEERADVEEALVRVTHRRTGGQQASGGSNEEPAVELTRVSRRADATAVRPRVEVALRPAPDRDPRLVLRAVRDYLESARLCGTDVWVRLAEPVFVSIELVVDVHPEVSAADLRVRLRDRLLLTFGTEQERLLGRERTLAEIYAAVESVQGVVWSQLIGFDRASAAEPSVQDRITPQFHQIVRCLDLPHQGSGGSITIWTARRYRVQLELSYADPDERPSTTTLIAALKARLSGRRSVPAREGWREMTIQRLNEVVSQVALPSQGYGLTVLVLLVGQRRVERIPLLAGELPILDDLQFRERNTSAHYRLELEMTWVERPSEAKDPDMATPRLKERIRKLLSGPQSVPAMERWTEITVASVEWLLRQRADELLSSEGQFNATFRVLGLMLGNTAAERLSLSGGEVPILDALHLAIRRPHESA